MGFTLVELMIAIAIMTILLLMGLLNLTNTEAPARDEERKTDATNISMALERIYESGNPRYSLSAGRYPSTGELNTAIANGTLDNDFLLEANKTDFYYSFNKDQRSLILKTGSNIDTIPSITNLQIMYEPIYRTTSGGWELCTLSTQDCRRYNLYYLLERKDPGATTGPFVKTIRSTMQQ